MTLPHIGRNTGHTIGDIFPNLRGETQHTNNFNLYDHFGSSWGIIFMHPADFTPVCTTELGAAQSLVPEFEARNVKLCGFSCDDSQRHQEWIEDIEVATGHKITFPLFCDPSRVHAVDLGVLDPKLKDDDGMPLTVRSVFILKPNREIALTMTYPACVGRNFDEILRTVDALQRNEEYGVVTPANWRPGDKTIVGLSLDDGAARKQFGKNGYETMKLPSESGKHLKKHYLRYTDDPILKDKSKQTDHFPYPNEISSPWRPPKSFAKISDRKQSMGGCSTDSATYCTASTHLTNATTETSTSANYRRNTTQTNRIRRTSPLSLSAPTNTPPREPTSAPPNEHKRISIGQIPHNFAELKQEFNEICHVIGRSSSLPNDRDPKKLILDFQQKEDDGFLKKDFQWNNLLHRDSTGLQKDSQNANSFSSNDSKKVPRKEKKKGIHYTFRCDSHGYGRRRLSRQLTGSLRDMKSSWTGSDSEDEDDNNVDSSIVW